MSYGVHVDERSSEYDFCDKEFDEKYDLRESNLIDIERRVSKCMNVVKLFEITVKEIFGSNAMNSVERLI